jgi:hypothetical protein
MPINVTAAGAAGTHSFAKTNVNTVEDYIFYKNSGGDVIPAAYSTGRTFIYTPGAGSITGVNSGDLVYVIASGNVRQLKFSASSGGAALNFTGAVGGSVKFNNPTIYDNKLNIDGSFTNNQAVKYYTTGTPMTGLVSGNTYFLRNVSISSFAGAQSLYTLTSNTHTFTSGGVTGRVGPDLATLRASYATAAAWRDTYLQQGNFQGYQDWTVPVSGIYEFDARGASGFDGAGAGGVGRGAIVKGRVSLTKGEIITIVCGQIGTAPTSGQAGGSGGGTFVVRKAGNVPLFVAGGGSAESGSGIGRDGVTTNLGGTSTGLVIAGGASSFGGRSAGGFSAGGGGFAGGGQDALSAGANNLGGGSYSTGLIHNSNARIGGFGGFGGAGQSDGNTLVQSGGAGGYSGGGGARTTTNFHSGGGGGSFITAEANTVSTSNGQYNSSSSFNGVAITNLNAYNTGNGTVIMSLVTSFTSGNEIYPTALDAENGTNKIAIASAGNSYHGLVPISLDIQNDLIHTAAGHGLSNGQAVTYLFQGTIPAGVANNTTYYINTVNNYTYRISTTPSPTFTTINLTTPSSRSTGASDVVRGVVVNTALDTLTINNHGFQVDQPIQYDAGGGTPIAPLQDQTTYFVQEVIDANNIRLKISLNALSYINFTAPGTSTTNSFIFVTVNLLNDELYLPNHGLSNGQAVRYSTGGGTPVGGLTNNATYFVIKRDNSIIRLASSAANAAPGPSQTAVNLTTVGTGTQTLTVTALDFTTNTFTIPSHGFLQGELVQYDSQGQTVINGLTTATPYYVIFVNGDNIRLATTPENAIAGTAIDIIASPAGVGTHKLTSLSKTPDGTYDIATVPSATSFTAIARGTVPTIVKTFNPRSTVDLNLETFKIPSHGFLTGTAVTYSAGGDTAISGLTNATVYYVVAVNRDYIKLSTTALNSESGITLSVSDFGTGATHSFTTTQINGNVTGGGNVTIASGSVLVNGSGTSFSKVLKVGDPFRLFPPNTTLSKNFAPADVNTVNNRITIASHGFTTGDSVVFSTGGGVAPSPLIDQYYYFVRAVNAGEVTLHGSAADATGNTSVVVFSTQGTAGASPFNLTRTTPVSPIIRKITAIGSDLQLSVDRPYSSAYSAQSYSYPTFIYVRPQGYALHRPFDGGVEMSTGANISLGVIVRQTRKYFRYQSGKGIQTSCGINFQPSIDIDTMVRTTSTTVTVTTRRPHGLISGLFVRISQAEDSFGVTSQVYNGDYQVTVPVGSLTTFTINRAAPTGTESKAFGFPQFYVREWTGGAVRSGMFDFQNGMFFEFDGQKIYACRRSSTQQMAGTISALQGSEVVFGTGTNFTGQVHVGDYIVLRGQSYRVAEITSDTQMSIRPEYKGASGTEKEFNPGNGTTGVVKLSTDRFDIVSHGFSQNLPLVYNSIDGEQIGGLINGRTYYCDIIDNNAFKLMANPNTPGTNVDISSVGTSAVHSFTPAKSGIIATLTVDVKIPQENWNIDPCDGTGVTGYDLNLSRIQMAYIDYSWYGAGKIRFGFKTAEGQVQYVHEFVHNNILYESYLRSGNLPARYEVVTYDSPTYIPYLFHWGTSVIMDGRYDADRAYLFTATGQTLSIPGTTRKTFASTGINLATDLLTVQTHGFNNGDIVQFQSIAATGARGANTQNPATAVVGSNALANLTNNASYKILVNSANLIHLLPVTATISLGATQAITSAQSGNTVTITTTNPHGITTGMPVGSYFGRVPTGVYTATRVSDTVFTYNAVTSATVASAADPNIAVTEVINITSQGSTQFTYFLFPDGSVNNSSGPNYQPLLSIRLSPSVSSGLTGKLGDRDVINRMQLRLQEIGISSTQLVDVKLLLNARLNNLNFVGVTSPSLCQIVEHTSADTVSGGVQVYNFRASGGSGVGVEGTTSVNIGDLFELSNSILGGDSVFPDGPDILTVAVSRLVGGTTLTSAKLSWTEAQA